MDSQDIVVANLAGALLITYLLRQASITPELAMLPGRIQAQQHLQPVLRPIRDVERHRYVLDRLAAFNRARRAFSRRSV